MQEKELIKELQKISGLSPDPAWKKESRELLFNQINSAQVGSVKALNKEIASTTNNYINWLPFRVMRNISQPVMVAIFIALFLLGSGTASLYASKNTKPGDSLYIAKIINEKAHLVLTFDEEKKARLGMEFACNRAWELNQVLAEEEHDKQGERVEKLVNDFRKEIDIVKDRLVKISNKSVLDNKFDEPVSAPEYSEKNLDNNDNQIFSANMGRDENGITVAETTETNEVEIIAEPTADTAVEPTVIKVTEEEQVVPTTTLEQEGITTTTPEQTVTSSDTETILEEAGELLDDQNYDATISKLEEAGEMIDLVGVGQVKGESEVASSVEEIIEN